MRLNKNTYQQLIRMEVSLWHVATRMVPAPSPWERVGVRLSVRGLRLCSLLFILTACTRADIMYYQGTNPEGMVYIQPDNSEHSLPAQRYYFYNQDGVTPCINLGCDGRGNFSGKLPVGTYRVVAANTSASGVEFRGMDSHETAIVYASGLIHSPLSRSLTPRGSIDPVFSTVIEELAVTEGDTLRHSPAPVLLTKTITITFTLDELLQQRVTGLSGTLRGVYPSVHLFSQRPADEAVAVSPDMLMEFSASRSDQFWSAAINLFGLRDPKHGEVYQNQMSLTLTIGNTQSTVEVDLTDELSNLIADNDGTIPVEVPLEIQLKWDGVTINGIVKPWQTGGTGEGEV